MRHPQEIAPHVGVLLWRVEEGHDRNNAELLDTYAWCRDFIGEFTSQPVDFYYDHDHPDIVAMIGIWNSVEEHFEDLHKSTDFIEIIHAFGGVVDVRASFHVNISKKVFEEINQGGVLVVNRIWTSDEDNAEYEKWYTQTFLQKAVKAHTKNVATGYRITEGGWKEMDAFDYFEDDGVSEEAIAKEGSEEEDDLQQMNELVTLIGCEDIAENESLLKKSRGVSDTKHRDMIKRTYSRRFVKMELPPRQALDDEDEDDEDD